MGEYPFLFIDAGVYVVMGKLGDIGISQTGIASKSEHIAHGVQALESDFLRFNGLEFFRQLGRSVQFLPACFYISGKGLYRANR